MDKSRESDVENSEAHALLVHRAGLEGIDDDIGVSQMSHQSFASGRLRKIEHASDLVAIEPKKVRRNAVGERGPPPARFVALRRLDLDDVRAVIAEDLCPERSAEDSR